MNQTIIYLLILVLLLFGCDQNIILEDYPNETLVNYSISMNEIIAEENDYYRECIEMKVDYYLTRCCDMCFNQNRSECGIVHINDTQVGIKRRCYFHCMEEKLRWLFLICIFPFLMLSMLKNNQVIE